MIEYLLNKKVLFFTGKGGTGKTTTAAALAIMAARHHRKVLLVEVDMSRPSVEDIFGKPLKFAPSRIADGIDGVNVDFFEALRTYLAETIPVEMVVATILKNKVVRYFLESTPFAREIALLSTFHRFYEQAVAPGGYDLVIVDLPSTGHALPILGVPQHVFRMFRIGPLLKRANEMQEFLGDRNRVGLCLVTLPEDMPVNETIEVYQKIRQEFPIEVSATIVNRLPMVHLSADEGQLVSALKMRLPPQASPRVQAMIAGAEEAAIFSERCRLQLDRLRQNLLAPFIMVSELGEPHVEPTAYRMARVLEDIS